MMDDRTLLELAAKAAGMETMWDQPRGATTGRVRARNPGALQFPIWNPLEDDATAFRLAVKLAEAGHMPMLSIGRAATLVEFDAHDAAALEPCLADIATTTRRAIVRAAAEITRAAAAMAKETE